VNLIFLLLILVGGFILFFTSSGRRLLMMIIVLGLLATWGYNQLMTRVDRAQQSVSASVDAATSAPGRLLASLRDTILGWLGVGGKIMKPLVNAADESTELYEYCLADATYVKGNVNPSACQALSGPERTTCFENQLKGLQSYDGVFGDLTDVKTQIRNACETRFKVYGAMNRLLDAGVRGIGELYGHCKVDGVCVESDFDNAPYRECLYNKFKELGHQTNYCSEFNATEDREKWRKCMEVSMILQDAKADVARLAFDSTLPAIRAIRACRAL
jgi:hypothetical protein